MISTDTRELRSGSASSSLSIYSVRPCCVSGSHIRAHLACLSPCKLNIGRDLGGGSLESHSLRWLPGRLRRLPTACGVSGGAVLPQPSE